MLRLQAQFPSVISTVYRYVCLCLENGEGGWALSSPPWGSGQGRSKTLANWWCLCALSSRFQDQ